MHTFHQTTYETEKKILLIVGQRREALLEALEGCKTKKLLHDYTILYGLTRSTYVLKIPLPFIGSPAITAFSQALRMNTAFFVTLPKGA